MYLFEIYVETPVSTLVKPFDIQRTVHRDVFL